MAAALHVIIVRRAAELPRCVSKPVISDTQSEGALDLLCVAYRLHTLREVVLSNVLAAVADCRRTAVTSSHEPPP